MHVFFWVGRDFALIIFVFLFLSHQGPFQLAAARPQSIRTRIPQEVRSNHPLLLCQVSLFSLPNIPLYLCRDDIEVFV